MKYPKVLGMRGKPRENWAIVQASRLAKGIDPNKVVFESWHGRGYSDNPRAISERLHAIRPQTEIVWLFRNSVIEEMRRKVPEYVRCVSVHSRAVWVELATARVWVDNYTKPPELRGFPKGKQCYVQTWNGDRPIRKIGYDARPDGYLLEQEASRLVTGSDFSMSMYRSAFHYEGEYIHFGAPRNDILVKRGPEDIARVRRKLGVPEGVKLLLYAPTYRADRGVVPKSAQMNLVRVMDLLESGGERWMCLYRAHYLSGGIDLKAVKDRLIDMTNYDDMSELLLASDMLLTDYSSCATDYCLLDRPVFMFMPDCASYIKSGSLYYDPHDTPLMIAHSQDELERLIEQTDAAAAARNCAAIRKFYGVHETGHATAAVCNYIIERMMD